LHKFLLRPGLGERPHIREAPRTEAFVTGKLDLQVLGAAEHIPADRSVEQDQLGIDRERGTDLGGANASFELLEQLVVACVVFPLPLERLDVRFSWQNR